MKTYHLYLIRHGQTRGNEEGLYIGSTDLPLSEKGRAELERLMTERDYPKPEIVYTSPLERCVQTADLLFPERELVEVEDLREMDFGAFEGCKAVELAELESYKKWLKGGLDNAPPNGETLREVVTRCYSSVHSILLHMMQNDYSQAAVVTHSGIIMNICSCFGLPKRPALEYAAEPGTGFEVMTTAQLWQQGGALEIVGAI